MVTERPTVARLVTLRIMLALPCSQQLTVPETFEIREEYSLS